MLALSLPFFALPSRTRMRGWIVALAVVLGFWAASCRIALDPGPLFVCVVNGDTLPASGGGNGTVRCASSDSIKSAP